MRTAAIDILRAVGVDCGGSNVQFGYHRESRRMVVIEMNPRVSRSSALASKATGFPIARASARLAVGYTLDEVINEITGKTVSSFEPALDYVAVKVPRFELEKFPRGYASLGTQMKSVGESLALGRTFPEALNKAFRAVEYRVDGVEELQDLTDEELRAMVEALHPRRLTAIYTLLSRTAADHRGDGEEMQSIMEWVRTVSGYDQWFIHQLLRMVLLEREIRMAGGASGPLDRDLLLRALRGGLTDRRIAALCGGGCTGETVERWRRQYSLAATYHLVDTCAGEFHAATPYFYSTWGETDEGEPLGEHAVAIIGSGPNRIGQGLEFDTCCTLSSLAFRRRNRKTIIINSNPETVSTDFNVSDRLYLEPLTAGDVLSVLEKEKVRDVIIQLGGQTPLNMAHQLERAGMRIVGTALEGIHAAEDREQFAALVTRLGLRQPRNCMAGTGDAVRAAAQEIGFPVLLRPSFVLGGRSMTIAYTMEDLDSFLATAPVLSQERPILVDQFLEDAFEYDVDALCDGEHVYIGGIMQHIEAAGIHSGDSACVFPPFKSDRPLEEEMVSATAAIARAIPVRGFLNIQFAVQNGALYVLEVNPRASRTVPFLSKTSGVDLVDAAVGIWNGEDLRHQGLVAPSGDGIAVGTCVTSWAVKEAMFSFDRFADHDPLLGPEMRSTGESIGIGGSFGEAFAKATLATGVRLPQEGRVFVSVHDEDKQTILPVVRDLIDMGFSVCASRGTAAFLFREGIMAEVLLKVHEGHPHVVDHLAAERIDLVINTPLGRFTHRDDDALRIAALRHRIPCTTTTSAARAAVEAIRYLRRGEYTPRQLPDRYAQP